VSLGELFDPAPEKWGGRGDTRLWSAMSAALQGRAMPHSARATRLMLRQTFREYVGEDVPSRWARLKDPAWVYVEDLAIGSGISDGKVSLIFWRDTAIPLLLHRWAAARKHQPRG
jgi:hypothetical protein